MVLRNVAFGSKAVIGFQREGGPELPAPKRLWDQMEWR
jgi:hypothetical protein